MRFTQFTKQQSDETETGGRTISQRDACGGFTIIELIVTLAVFVMLSSVLLMSYSSMNKHLDVDMLAQEIGQWVRDAQVSAMSVRQFSQSAAVPYPGYGIHFSTTTPQKLIYFADIHAPFGKYEALTGGQKCGDAEVECKQEITLTQGNSIYSLCGGASGAYVAGCSSPNGASSYFDIVFTRPNPDAKITGDVNGNGVTTNYDNARITITSLRGYKRTIEVWTTGQISIQ